MKLGIQTGKVNKTFSARVQIAKAGSHKYVKREGTPGNYKYYYRLPDGSIGTKEELKAAENGKKAKEGHKPTVAKEDGKKRLGIRKPEGKIKIKLLLGGDTKEVTLEQAKKWARDVTNGTVLSSSATLEEKIKYINSRVEGIDAKELLANDEPKGENTNTDVKTGDNVSSVVNGKQVSGKVTGVGTHGVTIDHKHQVEYDKVKKQKADSKSKKKETNPEKQKTFIPPENFNAADWSKQWDDPKATADEAGKEYILNSFGEDGEEIANAIRDADSKNQRLIDDKQLTHKHRISGEGESARYTPEREKIHGKIMNELLSPFKLRTALPPSGEKPKFIILGGRGGSGKSWFENNLYDPDKCVILDADKIKAELPEYKGWNANQVHEESSDIIEQMLTTCIRNGLNVVLDATMKTADTALSKVFRFKSAGYKTEAHYMHLPKQEAAKRAIGRFKGTPEKGKEDEYKPFSGRYVPVTAVLKNTTNEDSFDQVRKIVDEWSFRDNNVKKNEQPILISEGKKEVKKSFAALVKSIVRLYN